MNEHLLKTNYLYIPNFISTRKAKSLSSKFKLDHEKNNYPGDSQAPNSACVYGYAPADKLMKEKIDELSELVGEPLLSTYTYCRIYANGEELTPHTDRPACELTVSVNLDCDKVWPIYIHDADYNEQEILLNPGDAAVFLGCFMSHWRNKFEGEFCSQFFLHYVRKNGCAANQDGDKVNGLYDEQEVIAKLAQEYIQMGWNAPEKFRIKNPQYSSFADYIVVFEDVLSDDKCDAIVSHYEKSLQWKPALTTGDVNDNNQVSTKRKCDTINISSLTGVQDKYIDEQLFNVYNQYMLEYCKTTPHLSVEEDEGYMLLRYHVGGEYIEHVDAGKANNRTLSSIIALNDDYEGGEIEFFGGPHKIRLKKGSVMFFPSSFQYPHRICPITSGVRYSVVTWFV